MFSYSPTTQDRSGEIMAAGTIGAAQSNAQMMGQLGQDIGGALASIGNIYGELEGMKAKGRAFKKTMEVVGPSFGMTTDKLAAIAGTDLKNDMDWARFGETMMPMMPSLINATLAQGRMGIQQNAPYVDQMLDNQRDVGAGNQTITPGSSTPPVGAGDPANTVPLPEADTPLPAVRGAPGTAVSVPGGRASWDARNRDRQKRGLQPLPYPPGLE